MGGVSYLREWHVYFEWEHVTDAVCRGPARTAPRVVQLQQERGKSQERKRKHQEYMQLLQMGLDVAGTSSLQPLNVPRGGCLLPTGLHVSKQFRRSRE